MKAYRLYLIRHGLTEANTDGRYIGATDIPLSEDGKEKILSLKDNFEYPKVQKVYTSPLIRAVQTANLIYPDNYTVNVDSLREYSFGEFENRSIEELAADPAYKEWMSEYMNKPPKGGESKEQFVKRVISGFNFVLTDMMKNGITSATLIGHGAVLASLLAMYGIPKRSASEWILNPGEGYALLTTAQMWTRDQMCEVCDCIPYGKQAAESIPYHWINLD